MKIYLASPYAHHCSATRRGRFECVAKAAGDLLKEGYAVYAPIAHSHPIHLYGDRVPDDWKFWRKHDLADLEACDVLVVLKLKGWDTSVGVADEVTAAHELCKRVGYLDYGKTEIKWELPIE